MPIVNGYVTLAQLKAYVSPAISDSSSDTQLEDAVNAASRLIDNYCQRRFWLDGSVVARTFAPRDRYCLDLREISFADIGASAGVIVETDSSGDGTFETVWGSSDFQLLPTNAAYEGSEARPWTGLRAVGAQVFPVPTTWLQRHETVRVTAKWGWPAVPEPVRQACLIQAQRIFGRPGAPLGVAGFSEMGAVVRLQRLDPDVEAMLNDYRHDQRTFAL